MSTTEKRIVASRPIIGTRPAPVPVAEEPKKGRKDKEGGGRGKTGLLVGIIVVLVLGGAAAYWFLLGPGSTPADPASPVAVVETEPEAGEVQPLESVSLNLAGGRYLRIGVALQLTKDAGHLDTARAVDTVLTHYSGRTIEEVSGGETRERLRTELEAKLSEVYDGAVMGVYLTDYVTQ